MKTKEKMLSLYEKVKTSRYIQYASLFFSFIGFLSFLGDLLPTFVKVSFLLKKVISLYHYIRDSIFNLLDIILNLFSISLPIIPDVTKDVITISLFIFSILSIENYRRFKNNLFISLVLDFLDAWSNRLFSYRLYRYSLAYDQTETNNKLASNIAIFINFICIGYILSSLFFSYDDVINLKFVLICVLFSIASYILFAVTTLFEGDTTNRSDNTKHPPKKHYQYFARFIILSFTVINNLIILLLFPLIRARKTVLKYISVLILIFLLNFLFLYFIDPILIDPPEGLKKILKGNKDIIE